MMGSVQTWKAPRAPAGARNLCVVVQGLRTSLRCVRAAWLISDCPSGQKSDYLSVLGQKSTCFSVEGQKSTDLRCSEEVNQPLVSWTDTKTCFGNGKDIVSAYPCWGRSRCSIWLL